jgi:5-methylcytosine-specific restriction endonuclease McrA
MKVSDELKEEIIDTLNQKTSKYFKHNIYDNCLSSEYIDSNGKPTKDLILLEFKHFDRLIENFLECKNSMSFNNIEWNDFSKKFNIIYEIIRNEFGEKLQKENEIYICPYCEKNYVGIIDTYKKAIKPDLDHFYPKSLYPFLACSIENLIPACQVCNSRLKKNKDFFTIKHINPLEERIFEKMEFNYNASGIYLSNKLSFTKEEEKNYLNTFKIQEVYSSHIEILEDIKTKFDKYNKVKRKHLTKCCKSLPENQILEIIFYEYKIENPKYPLRRLKKSLYKKIEQENEPN